MEQLTQPFGYLYHTEQTGYTERAKNRSVEEEELRVNGDHRNYDDDEIESIPRVCPVVLGTKTGYLQQKFNHKNSNKYVVNNFKHVFNSTFHIIMIYAHKQYVNGNKSHNHLFKAIETHQIIKWNSPSLLRRYILNLWATFREQFLRLNPLPLVRRQETTSIQLLLAFSELLDNNTNKQIHDEERSAENEHHEKDCRCRATITFRGQARSAGINSKVHVVWPHLQSRYFKKREHRHCYVVEMKI